ncbi:MAG: hypothetical protein FWH27_12020 [Planctomycetaceae bacterium]|nr:hypothetical protein [Planctomycetaceae bacterium]
MFDQKFCSAVVTEACVDIQIHLVALEFTREQIHEREKLQTVEARLESFMETYKAARKLAEPAVKFRE